MNSIDGVREKYAQKGTPEDLVKRKNELLSKDSNGEITMFEYPTVSAEMWDGYGFI